MTTATISLKEALAHLRTGSQTTIEVCTSDGQRRIMRGRVANNELSNSPNPKADTKINAFHSIHATMNFTLSDGGIRKIYPALIERIDHKIIIQ
jgi:hypothetical protein